MARARRPQVWVQTIRTNERTHPGEIYARLRWTENGEEKDELLRWVTPEQAEDYVERKQAALRLGLTQPVSPSEPRGVTVRELLELFGEDVEARQVGGAGYRTNILNRSAPLSRHLGRFEVAELTLRDLEQYVATRRKERGGRELTLRKRPLEEGEVIGRPPKKATVVDEVKLLRRVIETTRRWGKNTPGSHAATFPGMPSFKGWPDDARPPRKLSDAEVEGLVVTAAIDRPELARLLRFLSWCPRRPVAIFALQRQHVTRALDPKYSGNDIVFFERDKGGVNRGWGPLLPEAREVLVEHLRNTIGPPDELVWKSATGKPYTAQILGRVFDYLTVKAKVPDVHPYDFRKVAAVRAYHATGCKLKATCRFTGHKEPYVLVKHYLFDEEDAVTAAVTGKARPAGEEG